MSDAKAATPGAHVCHLLATRTSRVLCAMRALPAKDVLGAALQAARSGRWAELAAIIAAHWTRVAPNLRRLARAVPQRPGPGRRMIHLAELLLALPRGVCCLGLAALHGFLTACPTSARLLLWLHGAGPCAGRPVARECPTCRIGGGRVRVNLRGRTGDPFEAPSAPAMILWLLVSHQHVDVAACFLHSFPGLQLCMESRAPDHPLHDPRSHAIQLLWMDIARRVDDGYLASFLSIFGIDRMYDRAFPDRAPQPTPSPMPTPLPPPPPPPRAEPARPPPQPPSGHYAPPRAKHEAVAWWADPEWPGPIL